MSETKMRLEDWLDDLCARFIINLPREELEQVERICFQVEEAQWFYEDFIRPLDPALPSLPLRAFALRIFQHCPLMSSWSEYHHTTAFSEFLAYKTRVPVRGAILLNREMDEVVLVKGWKKGANWSFPRGKINKDEKDLDCAIREVYEETGYDVREAGLIENDADVQYIEMSLREQHMRLYVIRDVPKDTYFEPRTRKEISKIEWYKLSDLPTQKRNKNGLNPDAVAANKFYMVAPFLNPLRRWIAQQKRRNTKSSIVAGQTDPEMSMDETFTTPNPAPVEMTTPHSNLPEVATSQNATSHLKRLLNINNAAPVQTQLPFTQGAATADAEPSKSNALLDLLRSGASHGQSLKAPQPGFVPGLDYSTQHLPPNFPGFPPQAQFMGQPPDLEHFSQPPHLPISRAPPSTGFMNQAVPPPASGLDLLSMMRQGHPAAYGLLPTYPRPIPEQTYPEGHIPPKFPGPPPSQHHAPAPYQQTGDPQFSHPGHPSPSQGAVVPPASKLPPPKLNSHSLALLNVFKEEAMKTPKGDSVNLATQPGNVMVNRRKPSQHQDQLLNLLKGSPAASPTTPAELPGAAVSPSPRHILQRPRGDPAPAHQGNVPKSDAWTSATVSGPLNMPQFETSAKPLTKGSPGTSNRKSGRDRQGQGQRLSSPITILPRPQSAKKDQTSTQGVPPSSRAGPRPRVDNKSRTPEPAKPFQPQILRRPENLNNTLPMRPKDVHDPIQADQPAGSPVHELKPQSQANFDRRPSQTAAQKETLLSLFGKSAGSPGVSPTEQPNFQTSTSKPSATSSIVSPLSPLNLSSGPAPTSEPISISQDDTLTPGANRIASPDNKAFLLGFLQGVAKGNK
ncbi:mRNA-decapping enzyme subunit 2 [Aspergillus nanangensis]|uniref:mRNA-decapping enzyme subunit 2 n=1 Tax=Aspergillus nanangensis TaxID=2582783 RepID=A0AAD4CN78_ASPNN|nr:mRNA-decapping enzyme subunit 2 [Aspergillus nanangensis]